MLSYQTKFKTNIPLNQYFIYNPLIENIWKNVFSYKTAVSRSIHKEWTRTNKKNTHLKHGNEINLYVTQVSIDDRSKFATVRNDLTVDESSAGYYSGAAT